MTKDEALKLALEGLEKWAWGKDPRGADGYITAIQEALAQPEQEHVIDCPRCGHCCPQTEQEPVAWRTFDGEGGYDYRDYEMNENYRDEYIKRNGTNYASWVEPLYTIPPHRKPLTDEEIKRMAAKWFLSMYWPLCNTFARAIEAAHGIKE